MNRLGGRCRTVRERGIELADHIADLVASAPAPPDDVIARIRRLLPPVDLVSARIGVVSPR